MSSNTKGNSAAETYVLGVGEDDELSVRFPGNVVEFRLRKTGQVMEMSGDEFERAAALYGSERIVRGDRPFSDEFVGN